MRGDRLAVGPNQIVAQNNFVVQTVFARLPRLHMLGQRERLHRPVEAKQSKADQSGDVEFAHRILKNRIGAFHITANPAHASLFSGKPYGVRVLPFSERNANAIDALSPASDCDLAILPGENRYAVVARAIGARWIAGFTQGRPSWRNRVVDEFLSLPPAPMAKSIS